MASVQGNPCWYELATTDLAGAQAFYGPLVGWTIEDSGMPDFDYRLARSGEAMVAGLWAPQDDEAGPPAWCLYFAADDCDATAAAVTGAGGSVLKPPADIPGTGRFAVLADPQGAVFGILQPLDGGTGTAFNQQKTGHGNWHELMTADPKAAMRFYGAILGWTPSRSMDMGEMGSYDIFAQGGADIGGMMRLAPGMPGPAQPFWLPYFGCKGIEAAIARVSELGGAVLHGPQEVPGGAFILVATDPQGAMFALVGPK